ncbi:MAG TPA: DUF4142 domain-containing protein [Chitinophagaceae bacterium]|nr:DUF4142 domain-containing protein [Chitinophagaceae bacterium]
MKNLCSLSIIMLSFIVFQSCNNNGHGSKQKADSINEANGTQAENASDFMVDASMINRTEILLGDIAQEKATIRRVKNFASMIVRNHKKANKKLKILAQEKKVVLPQSLDPKHKADSAKLKDKKGRSVDQIFITDMVKGHKAAIARFQKAKNKVDDSDIKTYIMNILPQLQEHFDSAEAIQAAMKDSSQKRRKQLENK